MIKIKHDNDLFMGIKAVWRLKDLVKAVIYMLIFVFLLQKASQKTEWNMIWEKNFIRETKNKIYYC